MVTFGDGSRHVYALMFRCDGNRSNTRRLAFGGTEDFSCFMGGYFFIKVVPNTGLLPANVSQIFSVPGRTALLNGYDNQTDVAPAFRTKREIDYDHHDRAQQRRITHDHFDGLGWKVPAMLEQVDADDEFYFDKINRIRMPVWSKGRVTLVGVRVMACRRWLGWEARWQSSARRGWRTPWDVTASITPLS